MRQSTAGNPYPISYRLFGVGRVRRFGVPPTLKAVNAFSRSEYFCLRKPVDSWSNGRTMDGFSPMLTSWRRSGRDDPASYPAAPATLPSSLRPKVSKMNRARSITGSQARLRPNTQARRRYLERVCRTPLRPRTSSFARCRSHRSAANSAIRTRDRCSDARQPRSLRPKHQARTTPRNQSADAH